MLQPLKSAFGRIARNPLKGVLLLLAFALNAALLSLVFSVYLTFRGYVSSNLLLPGTGVWVMTFPTGSPGSTQKRAELHTAWTAEIKERAGLRLASPFYDHAWQAITVGTKSYALSGGAIGAYPDYAAMCDLRLIAGSLFSEAEVDGHRGVAVVSENVAKAIWGSAEAAVGGDFVSVPYQDGYEDPSAFRVVGVFAEPPEIQRRFRHIPGVLVSYDYFGSDSSGVPAGSMEVLYFRAQSDDPSLFRVKRRIRSALEAIYREANRELDPSIVLPIWEGSVNDPYVNTDAAFLGRIRVLSSFFGLMWVFCLLLLAFGVLALLSSDTAGRLKETGLRRAMGSSRLGVVALFAGEAAAIVAAANLMGAALVLPFIGPLREALKPLLAGGGPIEEVVFGNGPIWKAMLLSLVASVVAGALGSLYPAYSATRVTASEALREL